MKDPARRTNAAPALAAALLAVAVAGTARAGETGAPPPPPVRAAGRAAPAPRVVSWAVGRLEVVAQGKPRTLPEGTLVQGHTLRATVKARGDAPIAAGVLVLKLDAFSPSRDLPRQPKGLHYVKGTWRLVAEGASHDEKIRHAPDILNGYVTAALPADPTQGKGGFTLRTRLAPAGGGGPRAGDGSLTVSDALEAELVLTLR